MARASQFFIVGLAALLVSVSSPVTSGATTTPTTPRITNLPTTAAVGKNFTAHVATTGDGTKSVTSSTTCTTNGLKVSFIAIGTCTVTAQVTAGTVNSAETGNLQSLQETRCDSPLLDCLSIF